MLQFLCNRSSIIICAVLIGIYLQFSEVCFQKLAKTKLQSEGRQLLLLFVFQIRSSRRPTERSEALKPDFLSENRFLKLAIFGVTLKPWNNLILNWVRIENISVRQGLHMPTLLLCFTSKHFHLAHKINPKFHGFTLSIILKNQHCQIYEYLLRKEDKKLFYLIQPFNGKVDNNSTHN